MMGGTESRSEVEWTNSRQYGHAEKTPLVPPNAIRFSLDKPSIDGKKYSITKRHSISTAGSSAF